MNKRILIIMGIVLMSIGMIIVGCFFIKPTFDYLDIAYIQIMHGSNSIKDTYYIYNESNNIYIKMDKFTAGRSEEKQINITQDDFDKIVAILQKHQVHRWNGFKKIKVAKGETGINGFRLEVNTVDNRKIIASGTGIFPEGYYGYHYEMIKFLKSLFEID
jgi:hypothetical protein